MKKADTLFMSVVKHPVVVTSAMSEVCLEDLESSSSNFLGSPTYLIKRVKMTLRTKVRAK